MLYGLNSGIFFIKIIEHSRKHSSLILHFFHGVLIFLYLMNINCAKIHHCKLGFEENVLTLCVLGDRNLYF